MEFVDNTTMELDKERERCIADLLRVYHDSRMFINEKGYLQKLIDILYDLDYYENNESIFLN